MLIQKIYLPSHIKIFIWKKKEQTILVIFGLLGLIFVPVNKVQIKINKVFAQTFLEISSVLKTELFLYKSLIRNILVIFSRGLKIQLQLRGMGFRSQIKKDKLILKIGFSHLIYFNLPIGIKIKRIKKQKLNLYGITNQLLYQVSEHLRQYRFPDIYKAKGLVYKGEIFKLKQGKKKAK